MALSFPPCLPGLVCSRPCLSLSRSVHLGGKLRASTDHLVFSTSSAGVSRSIGSCHASGRHCTGQFFPTCPAVQANVSSGIGTNAHRFRLDRLACPARPAPLFPPFRPLFECAD